MRAKPGVRRRPATVVLLCVAAWAVPGLAHLWLRRRLAGYVFLVTLPLMFGLGLALHGRLFAFDWSQPLVALAAAAPVGTGLPYLLARLAGAGIGQPTAITYEYGNTFLMVAGLLNLLVVFDAFDVATGRKATRATTATQ